MSATAAEIEDLFLAGYGFDHAVSLGESRDWTRDDVLAVLKERQWDLDASGRLPRSKRVTTPPGLRHLQPQPASTPKRPAPPAAPRPREVPVPPPTQPTPTEEPAPVPEPTSAAPAKRKRQGTRSIDHGTPRGYWAEKDRNLPRCDQCKAAISRYNAEKKAERRRAAEIEAAAAPATFEPGDEPVTVHSPAEPLRLVTGPADPPLADWELELLEESAGALASLADRSTRAVAPPPRVDGGLRVGDPEWLLHTTREHEDGTVRRAAAGALEAWARFRMACEHLADAVEAR